MCACAFVNICVCVCGGLEGGSDPMKGLVAGIHEYFNILASSHIALCQALISPHATGNREKEGRQQEE
ncbi:hypothetical protein EXN66_Car012331 [Channa argus]|uniref:Uncharacterized protein n=1 Tax=Channa argus TaxID=215402 RepID=A0A6G1Q2R1_CHAAH|nr:hypothetical protein EXN66_Car012331 [Channa argus]